VQGLGALTAGIMLTPTWSYAGDMGETLAYSPGLIKKALADGKTVFVDYAADWCSTCAAQERAVNALRSETPAYNKAMVFVRVDWDEYSDHDVATTRNIPRRSTLILLRGEEELGRIVAGTAKQAIKELMDKGLDMAASG